MSKCFIRPLSDNPFRGVLPRPTKWEVFFNIEEKVIETDGSFQVNFKKDSVELIASTSSIAINEAKKLVAQWKGAYVTGIRKA